MTSRPIPSGSSLAGIGPRKSSSTQISGFSACAASASSASSTASSRPYGDTAVQITESQRSSPSAAPAAAWNSSAPALVARISGSGFSTSPAASAVAAICRARVAELVISCTRGPVGSGWRDTTRAASIIPCRRWVTITPFCRNRASIAASSACPRPPRTP